MRALIFDLDGTLIDSEPDLRAALNRLLADRGLSPLGAAAVRAMIGDGAKKLVERAFAAHHRAAGPSEFAEFLEDYEANATVATVVYPGIEPVLAALQAAGHKMAVCTNKPEQAARDVLQTLGLAHFFAAVVGGDGPHRKPDPRHLAQALAALGETDGIMIGDHQNDQAAAQGLNLPFIHAAWGYGKVEACAISRPEELLQQIATLKKASLSGLKYTPS